MVQELTSMVAMRLRNNQIHEMSRFIRYTQNLDNFIISKQARQKSHWPSSRNRWGGKNFSRYQQKTVLGHHEFHCMHIYTYIHVHVCIHVCMYMYMYMYMLYDTYICIHTCTVEIVMPQTQSSGYISKSYFRLTYSLKMARGIFGADVLTSSNFQDFVCNVQ